MGRLARTTYRALLLALISCLLVIGTCAGGYSPCGVEAAAPSLAAEWVDLQRMAMLPSQREVLSRFAQAPRYTIDASLDVESASLIGRMTLDYAHQEEAPLDNLVLRLWPNADTIYGGGSLNVSDVRRDGRSIPWRSESDPTILSVPLAPVLSLGDKVSLEISFVGQIPRSGAKGYRIYHASSKIISLAGWHPVLAVRENGAWVAPPVPTVGDANLADMGLYEVRLLVPEGYEVVATGIELTREETPEGVIWHLVSGPVRGFVVVVSDRFQHRQATVAGVDINIFTLAEARANISADTALDLAVGSFEAYEERFGPYPYAELDVVETWISVGGYEFPGLVVVDHEARRRGTYGAYRWLVAHEVAHQWWFGLVGNDSVAEPWLDESMATYAVALYLEREWGPASYRALLNSYQRSGGLPSGGGPPITSSASVFGDWVAYRNPVYYHGALFLAALREEMGDAAFFELIQDYQASFRYEQATTSDLLALARQMAPSDLEALISRWFGTSQPGRMGGPQP